MRACAGCSTMGRAPSPTRRGQRLQSRLAQHFQEDRRENAPLRSRLHQAEEMTEIFEEDANVCEWSRANQPLIHIGFPSKPLNVWIPTHTHESFAPAIAAVPEPLHDAEDEEHAAVRFHETF